MKLCNAKNVAFLQTHLNDTFDTDPRALWAHLDKKKSQSKSTKPKKSGTTRRSERNAMYPSKVMARLTEAMRRFLPKYGQQQVETKQINTLFDLVDLQQLVEQLLANLVANVQCLVIPNVESL